MNHSSHNKIVSFIWSIADDCLRDVYVRGKYRDVILPMVVLRRLDALLEASKETILEEVKDQIDIFGPDPTGWEIGALQEVSGYVFYNTSEWTLQKLKKTATNSQQKLEANFTTYINGFSKNVLEIIDKFKLRSQIAHMAKKDVLLDVLEKFTDPDVNLTHHDKLDSDGRKLPALTNLGMGYVFEELIRKFNEENNEEAGEHFTPREVIDLMTHLIFDPVKDNLPPVITIYDPACGSGGMLTESQNFIKDEQGNIRADAPVHLYGKEINDETYAICKSDMMIKGNNPENIKNGSTLATDDFIGTTFDFMLSNPPYGKSWSSDLKYIKDGKNIIDPRFIVPLKDYWGKESEEAATPRSSDGQLLFLVEMMSKMKSLQVSPIGSRIASVHNGSSLFTGDAGGGESNIRRYIIENDLLEGIVQMPNNLFYNTGITTYIWILTNHKSADRQGKVQLIDAGHLYRKLRKNLGAKNCEFAPEHIEEILSIYKNMSPRERGEAGGGSPSRELEGSAGNKAGGGSPSRESEGSAGNKDSAGSQIASQIFDNQDFGYYKATIERPKRLKAQFSQERIAELRFDSRLKEPMLWMYETYQDTVYDDIKIHEKAIKDWCEQQELNLSSKQYAALLDTKNWKKRQVLVQVATQLMELIGTEKFNDFNLFTKKVNTTLKEAGLKVSASEKKYILQAVSWYDSKAEKVIKKLHKLEGEKLTDLLSHLNCEASELADFGYYPSSKKHQYIEYQTESDLRDTENVPLKDDIHAYFLREVRPHVAEAWINLEATKIGYEISFNKYFYRHQPLRSLEAVSADILKLEEESDGLIREILQL